jgi:hypothetical protein
LEKIMPRTRINCPNCRQPVLADIDQLFDVTADPAAKQRFLSGAFNVIQCQACGYQGMVATPLVYHDADKELLMTFVPPELGLPRDEQERMIGSMINQVINKLPQEKRKGYLLNPQSALTMQGLMERVLETEGITREMIQAQQQRLSLLRRLVSLTDDSVLQEVAHQEDALIDGEFFMLLSRLIEAGMASGDQESSRALADLQKKLLPITTYGRQVQAQSQEIQAAVNELQALGKDLTREKFLDLLLDSTSEMRTSVLVSLARPLMDYQFFQLLSGRIEKAQGEEQARLMDLRPKLLEMTQEIDRQTDSRRKQARAVVEALLQAEDLNDAILQNLQGIDDFFMQELSQMLDEARRSGDLQLSAKINQIGETIQQMSTPPELALVEEYLDMADEKARQQFLETHQDQINDEFLEMLANIVSQVDAGGDQDSIEYIRAANRQALHFSMKKNLGS